jgi:hypothetical protein
VRPLQFAPNYCRQFAEWTREVVFFVTRRKKKAKTEVIETLCEYSLEDREAGKTGKIVKP